MHVNRMFHREHLLDRCDDENVTIVSEEEVRDAEA